MCHVHHIVCVFISNHVVLWDVELECCRPCSSAMHSIHNARMGILFSSPGSKFYTPSFLALVRRSLRCGGQPKRQGVGRCRTLREYRPGGGSRSPTCPGNQYHGVLFLCLGLAYWHLYRHPPHHGRHLGAAAGGGIAARILSAMHYSSFGGMTMKSPCCWKCSISWA